ncbi:restriction endonuclease subunit S [uncultured Flavobacterium sp.]|uniref:restriction endonuclease subunit S n=1 Tax=uncultured Flavobacterium sp. TaxID=165435 RepID=UPI0025926EDE|nr:restriction endonuclease subunit S [uncultured Flavobacterium sp.]
MEKQLPKNWIYISFTEVFDINGGTQPPKSVFIDEPKEGYIRLLQIRDFGNKPVPTYIPDTGKLMICKKDDILIARYGASIGRIVTGMEGSYNVALAKVSIPESINKNFVKWLLKSNIFQEPILSIQRTAQNGFNKTDLASIFIPLPPLAEQNRIAAKLDALFAQLETIKTSMAKVPLLLKDFRQQVLTQAVTGKLTEKWRKGKELGDMFDFISNISNEREKNYEELVKIAKKEKIKKPKKDFEFVFKKHPNKENWCIAKLENLVYMSARIGWKGLKAEEYTESGPLFISVHSLNYGENVNYEKAYHISEERFLESPEIMLEENDILLCKDGAGIGKLGIVKNLKEKATVNSSLLVIRGKEAFVNKFLFYFFSGPALQNIAKERITGTAIPHLFQRDIKEFYVDIPPLEEQQEIVSRVESLFAKADVIEKQYEILKAKIDSLPQAILHKAFKGELTQQLDSDGDARELLKQIRELKKSTVKPKKATSKKVKKYPGNETVLRMVAEPK